MRSNIVYQRQEGSLQGSEVEDRILAKASDDKVTFRWLKRTDHINGFPKVLAGLTKGCDYDEETYQKRFDQMFPYFSSIYKIVVIVNNANGEIVGAGTVVMEMKFIRTGGVVSNH
jgi:hypothetical protein